MPCGGAKMSEHAMTASPVARTFPHCLLEHNYAKPSNEFPEPMETSEFSLVGNGQIDAKKPGLSALDDTNDTFETFLLGLLKCHTMDQMRLSCAVEDSAQEVDISPESLNTLSQEQVHALVTSNSVNYDVVQQILAQRHLKQPHPITTQQPNCGSPLGTSTQHHSPIGSLALSNFPSASRVEQPVASLPTTVTSATANTSTTAPPFSLKLTPDQLKLLQSQVTELLRQQQSIPSNLTLQQQQALIQSLITQRLSSSLHQLLPCTTPTPPANTTSTVTTPTPPPVTSHIPPPVTTPIPPSVTTSTHPPVSTPTHPPVTTPTPPPVPPIPAPTQVGMVKSDVQSVPIPTNTALVDTKDLLMSAGTTTATAGKKTVEGDMFLCLGVDGPQQCSPEFFPVQSKDVSSGGAATAGRKRKDSESKSDMYPSLLEEDKNLTFAEVSKIVSSKWAKLGSDGKQKYYEKYEQMKAESQQKANSPSPMEVDQSKEFTGSPHTPTTMKRLESKPNRGKSRKKEEGLCVAEKCFKVAVYTQERGHQYCSNECVVKHCRHFFSEWVAQRKLKT